MHRFMLRASAARTPSHANMALYIQTGIICLVPEQPEASRAWGDRMSPTMETLMPGEMRFLDRARANVGPTVDDEDDLSAKSTLATKINALIVERGLSQVQAAELLHMSQPKISAIRNYKLQGISLHRLMQALTALGQQVEIVVTPSIRKARRRISVAA